ncbi:MAG: hypothetical protein OEV94_10345 [Deltaproteobacteria bacterium]|nr:hypothetical protein [Deltaproteobacteria bacterium]
MSSKRPAAEVMKERQQLLETLLDLSQRQLLMVNLDGLEDLIARKEGVIARLRELDAEWENSAKGQGPEASPWMGEMARLVGAILENEQAMERRMEEERAQLGRELSALERQENIKRYLGDRKTAGRRVDLSE